MALLCADYWMPSAEQCGCGIHDVVVVFIHDVMKRLQGELYRMTGVRAWLLGQLADDAYQGTVFFLESLVVCFQVLQRLSTTNIQRLDTHAQA